MRKTIVAILLLLSFQVQAKLKVFTTTTNLADIVRQVGGSQVDVESLCQGTQDPHFLEAKPSYTFKLSKADLLVSVGAGLEEGWLPLVIRGSRNPKIRQGQSGHLVASDSITMLEQVKGEVSRSHGDVHPEGNPHFMLSPTRSILIAKAVMQKLSELSPEHKLDFSKNFDQYKDKIDDLVKGWKKRIGTEKKVISYHKTLTYFYDDFGIQNVDVLEPKPGIPPSASHVLSIISKIKKQRIDIIIVENYFDDSVAKKIRTEIPTIRIEVVPVAVEGKKGVDSLFALYEYLVTKIEG